MAVKRVPEGYHTLTPHLIMKDAAKAIEFYKKAFGATERGRFLGPGGKIMHAELQIGDSRLMLNDEFPEMGASGPTGDGRVPVTIHVYVEDVDKVFKQAVAAGVRWLARHQNPDGSWGCQTFARQCQDPSCTAHGIQKDAPDYPMAATAFGLLPYLASGQTHDSKGPYQKTILNGLRWIRICFGFRFSDFGFQGEFFMPRLAARETPYSVHPGVAMVQKWIAELKEKTGRTLEEWIDLVRKEGPPEEKDRRDWLKTKHGFGTNAAWWIAERAKPASERGIHEDDPESYLKAAERYVEPGLSNLPALD